MNIKIYDLRHRLRCVSLSGPDRFCKAYPSRLPVGSTACGQVALWTVVGGRGGIALGPPDSAAEGRVTLEPPSLLPPTFTEEHSAGEPRGHTITVSRWGLTGPNPGFATH